MVPMKILRPEEAFLQQVLDLALICGRRRAHPPSANRQGLQDRRPGRREGVPRFVPDPGRDEKQAGRRVEDSAKRLHAGANRMA